VADQDEALRYRRLRDNIANALGEAERGKITGTGAVSGEVDGESEKRQKSDHVVSHPAVGMPSMHEDEHRLGRTHGLTDLISVLPSNAKLTAAPRAGRWYGSGG
jgi:hypothetical protein